MALPLDKLSKAVAAETWCWNSSVKGLALLGNMAIFKIVIKPASLNCLPIDDAFIDRALAISDLNPASPSLSSGTSYKAFLPSAPSH